MKAFHRIIHLFFRGPAWLEAAHRVSFLSALLSAGLAGFAADDYQLGPDSQPQDGVPKGRIEGPVVWKSQVFANTISLGG